MAKKKTCTLCNGSGKLQAYGPKGPKGDPITCSDCGGSGQVDE